MSVYNISKFGLQSTAKAIIACLLTFKSWQLTTLDIFKFFRRIDIKHVFAHRHLVLDRSLLIFEPYVSHTLTLF